MSNANAGNGTLGFAKSTPHSGLEPISSGTGQHFVDPEYVERMNADTDVELILGGVLNHVLKLELKIRETMEGFDFVSFKVFWGVIRKKLEF